MQIISAGTKAKKLSIAILIASKDNLKYYSNFSKTRQLPFNLRLYFNSIDGLRPLHNKELLGAPENNILPLTEESFVPESDYQVTISEDAILTENDIIKYIEFKLGTREENTTPLKELKPRQRKIKKERVSVIIPTYKRPKNLNSALHSVVTQDYPDIEVIVVCDNGKDSGFNEETRQIISLFEGLYSNCNIVLLEHNVNRNGAAARNTGILVSTGEYICFLDDDDVYLPGRISKSIEILKATNKAVGAVYCGYTGCNSPTDDAGRYKSGDLTLNILLLQHDKHYLHTDTTTYKRESVLDINGFDETYRRHQDLEFNLRFFELYLVETIKESLVQRNPVPPEVHNQIFDLQMLKLKQKFLNRFSHIIQTYNEDTQKLIYEKNWGDAKKHITNRDVFIEELSKDFEEKLIYILDYANMCKNKLIQDGLMDAIENVIITPISKSPIQKYKAYKAMVKTFFDATKHSKH